MSLATLPPAGPVDPAAYRELRELVARGGLTLLTGAGMSTASGIPDYRSPDGRRRVAPMQYADFLRGPDQRRRYWARSYAGWDRFASAEPNAAHVAVARLQARGLVGAVITQNVDGLHQRAGAQDVLELHGTLARVVCLTCEQTYRRESVQEWLAMANPEAGAGISQLRPDGDVLLQEEEVRRFRLVRCPLCRSDQLKPDVVFFGGAVAAPLVQQAFELVEQASALLVLGSSLQVMSGYRFVRRAAVLGIPVAVVTRGATRADGQTTVHVDALLGDVLPAVVTDLCTG